MTVFFFHLLSVYLSYTPIKGFAMDIERCISLVCLWVFLELDFSRNFAYGNVARHNGIVVESNAYFFPEMSRMLIVRFSQASFII